MKIKNFISGGMLGDFIHSLTAVKSICIQEDCKANLYLCNGHGGDAWRYGIERAYSDLVEVISKQSYINKFEILPVGFSEEHINLNTWRDEVHSTHAKKGRYTKCWSKLLSEHYNFTIGDDYASIDVSEINPDLKDRVIMHRSSHHNKDKIFWLNEFEKIDELVMFVTPDAREWEQFEYKDLVRPYIVSTVSEWVVAINSAKYFIGNQSAGFAIANALDKKRLVELDHDPAPFYQGEEKYSKNISWFLSEQSKYIQ